LRAGLPTSVAGMSVDRQCASGLMAIAIAAKEIIDDGMSVTIGGGLEPISLVQNDKMNRYRAQDPWLVARRGDLYMTMLETAPLPSVMKVVDKATQAVSDKQVTLKQDEGLRADTTLEGLAALKPVFA